MATTIFKFENAKCQAKEGSSIPNLRQAPGVTCNAMSDFETYELCNVDPEDISDVLVKVERSFGFKFGYNELKDTKTFGELCDIIISKVQGDNSNNCTTQQAFYKLRDAIAYTLLIDKESITPHTDFTKAFS